MKVSYGIYMTNSKKHNQSCNNEMSKINPLDNYDIIYQYHIDCQIQIHQNNIFSSNQVPPALHFSQV